jgi:hypothetical protein
MAKSWKLFLTGGVIGAIIAVIIVMILGIKIKDENKSRHSIPPFAELEVMEYSYFLEALSQFPYSPNMPPEVVYHYKDCSVEYSEYVEYLIGTWVSINGPYNDFYHFQIVTRDSQIVVVSVKGDAVDLTLLASEINPITGKYSSWDPVIQFPKQPYPGEKYYEAHQVDVIGRFKINWGRNESGEQIVIGYENESYM